MARPALRASQYSMSSRAASLATSGPIDAEEMWKFRSNTPASLPARRLACLARHELMVNEAREPVSRTDQLVPQWTQKWVLGVSTRLGVRTMSCTHPEKVEVWSQPV